MEAAPLTSGVTMRNHVAERAMPKRDRAQYMREYRARKRQSAGAGLDAPVAPSRAGTWMLPGDVPGRVRRCRTAWRRWRG